MRQETRFKFNAYLSRVAELNGIDAGDVSKKFTVEPSVTQTLMNTMQESSDFLTRINIVPVSEMKGEKIGIGVTGSIASTTDTAGGTERQPKDFSKLASNKYECDQINFDFYIRYKTLDLWARYQDFQLRVRNAIIKRQSLDLIMAGFNGVRRAETSDRSSNPMLQDVAVGWLQKYRNEAPARVMSKVTDEEGHTTSEVIRVGKGGDYASLDALVMDATNNLIEPWYQEDPDLVVIVGRQLLADKYFPIVNKEQDNSEMLAADVIISQKRIGIRLLTETLELTATADMPDEVRAKLHKITGLFLRDAGDAAGALAHLQRATQLDCQAGVKKEIERLERELKPKPEPKAATRAPRKTRSVTPAKRGRPKKKAS